MALDRSRRRCQSNVVGPPLRCWPTRMNRRSRAKPRRPFRCCNSSPEVSRLVVLMHAEIRFALTCLTACELHRMPGESSGARMPRAKRAS